MNTFRRPTLIASNHWFVMLSMMIQVFLYFLPFFVFPLQWRIPCSSPAYSFLSDSSLRVLHPPRCQTRWSSKTLLGYDCWHLRCPWQVSHLDGSRLSVHHHLVRLSDYLFTHRSEDAANSEASLLYQLTCMPTMAYAVGGLFHGLYVFLSASESLPRSSTTITSSHRWKWMYD